MVWVLQYLLCPRSYPVRDLGVTWGCSRVMTLLRVTCLGEGKSLVISCFDYLRLIGSFLLIFF